jgi:hypothetical protein
MQERAETLDGTHRSLTATLVFGRSQHNGNIFAAWWHARKTRF